MLRRRVTQRPLRLRQRLRRGILLIVVLALLALFALVALTFVITSEQAMEGSLASAQRMQFDDPPELLLEEVLMQILTGSRNRASRLQTHGLLEDMYGSGIVGRLGGPTASAPSMLSQVTVSIGTGIGTNTVNMPVGFYANNASFVVGKQGQLGMLYFTFHGDQVRYYPSSNGEQAYRAYASDPNRFLEPIPGYYNGRVITMLTGRAKGKSSRINGYSVKMNSSGQPQMALMRLLPFDGMVMYGNGWSADNAPQNGDSFVINDLPFNGPGAGYAVRTPSLLLNPLSNTPAQATHLVDLTFSDYPWQVALCPNPAHPAQWSYLYGPDQTPGTDDDLGADRIPGTEDDPYWPGTDGVYGTGDAGSWTGVGQDTVNNAPVTTYYPPAQFDEDYDAPDFQNMILALRVSSPAGNFVPVPSLHRPDLISYWNNRLGGLPTELLRRVVLRPLVEDHPGFGNVNPNFDPAGYLKLDGSGNLQTEFTWDVDNDGDLRPDSIWVDLGLPAKRDPQGRLYKPMAAILVLDMDGKLNLNVVGQLNSLDNLNSSTFTNRFNTADTHRYAVNWFGGYPKPPSISTYTDLDNASQGPLVANVKTGNSVALPAGVGLSPASMSFYGAGFSILNPQEFRYLLYGRRNAATTGSGEVWEGRYGEGFRIGDNSADPQNYGGINGLAPPGPGLTGVDDNFPTPSAAPVQLVLPAPHTPTPVGNATVVGHYGDPFDLDDNGAVALDARGFPTYAYYGQPNKHQYTDVVSGNTGYQPEYVDEAYEFDPTGKRSYTIANPSSSGGGGGSGSGADVKRWKIDNPYSPEDLEALLRLSDVDAPTRSTGDQRSRLINVLSGQTFVNDPYRKSLVTTESWDVPVPSYQLSPELQYGRAALYENTGNPRFLRPNCNIFEMLEARIAVRDMQATNLTLYTPPSGLLRWDTRRDLLATLLPAEILLGLKMDLNKLWGNGFDDPVSGGGNYLVDDDAEVGNESGYLDANGTVISNVDRNADGVIDARDRFLPQQYATSLYLLMMLNKDMGYLVQSQEQNITARDRYELTVRQLAQWSINVADFRDRDNIISYFEYDVDPFNGWDVDGQVTTVEPDPAGTAPCHPDRRVVWGTERPLVILNETFAAHDLRVDDKSDHGGKTTDNPVTDKTVDQVRVPEGIAAIELMCVAPPYETYTQPRGPGQALYNGDNLFWNGNDPDYTTGDYAGAVNLSAMTGNNDPVWRIAISESSQNPQNQADSKYHLNFENERTTRPDTVSFIPTPFGKTWNSGTPTQTHQPEGWQNYSMAYRPDAPAAANPQTLYPERFVFFTNKSANLATVGNEEQRVFYNISNNRYLKPGQYAIVGSAGRATVTTANANPAETTLTSPDGVASSPIALMGPSQTDLSGFAQGIKLDQPRSPATIHDSQSTWTNQGNLLQGAVTPFPCAGWYAYTHQASGTQFQIGLNISEPLCTGANNGWYNTDIAGVTSFNPVTYQLQNINSQYQQTDKLGSTTDTPWDSRTGRGYPIAEDQIYKIGTTNNYKLVMLQRLADPTQSWNALSNPYITVDWLPIDLTVYNTGATTGNDTNLQGGNVNMTSRQRGAGSAAGSNLLWPPVSTNPSGNNSQRIGQFHTFGYLNAVYHTGSQSLHTISTAETLYGTYNAGDPHPMEGYPTNGGNNIQPFPWIPINNRLFASPAELLLVPSSSPNRLMWEFSISTGDPAPFYQEDASKRSFGRPFGHLLNFFFSSATNSKYDGVRTAQDNSQACSNYFRLFDFVTVPSKFSGSEIFLRPNNINSNNTSLTNFAQEFYPFYPPFNKVPTYREAGRINLNTISDFQDWTWRGVMNSFPGTGTTWNTTYGNLIESRQGFGTTAFNLSTNNYPTLPKPSFVSNPFRSFGNSYRTPVPVNYASGAPNLIDSTLFRPFGSAAGSEPMFTYQATASYNNSQRNAYFRFLPYQRLMNVTTTKSNVYAAWVTVGYFQVRRRVWQDSLPVHSSVTNVSEFTAAYPDGYEILGELGADTGNVRRHRGFFLIDRSLPVGFIRGERTNAINTVLLKRIIE